MDEETHESFGSLKEMEEAQEVEVDSIDFVDDDKLAVGFRVPTSVKTPSGYLDSLRSYNDVYNDIYQQMKVASKLYKFNAIIGNAVDVLVEFGVSQLDILPTKDKKLDKILKHWFDNLNHENTNGLPSIRPLLSEICLEWFTSGNVFPYQKWENVEVPKVPGLAKLPMSINLLNPQSIEIPEGPIAFGQEIIFLKPDPMLISKLRGDGRTDPESAILKAAIPRSILNAVRSTKGTYSGSIRLNPKFVSHLKRKAKGYQAWGVPYLTRCFAEASLLERLRTMDESIASGLINLVTIFKIGTEDHPATRQRLNAFANLLKNPKATSTLVWAHDVEILQVGPDGKLLQFNKKYEEAKQNLMIGLGVPPVLNSLDASGDPWVSIMSLVERLVEWRKTVSIWLEGICRRIAIENGYGDQKITLRWHKMNLQDDASVKNLLLSFYDRGLISVRDAIEESGRNFDAVVAQKKAEKQAGIDKIMVPPEQPFQGGKTSDGRPPSSSPKMVKESTDKSKTKVLNTNNLKEQKRKTPSSKVK